MYTLIRQIPTEAKYDVVVAGGGPAGVCAAIAAGRLGAKVLLVESTGCLGGMGTSGLVTAFNPMSDGERMLVGGIMKEIVDTLYQRGGLRPGIGPEWYAKTFKVWTPFKLEYYKRLLDELVVAAGVEVRFFTRVIDADVDRHERQVNGVILNNIEGYRYIEASAFIDCTGDAVLANLCGVACREAGRDTQRIMPATLPSLYAGIDWQTLGKGGDGWQAQYDALNRALADGHFTQHDRQLPGMNPIGRQVGVLNGGHLFNLNALRCKDLSEGVMLGRRIAAEYTEFYRKYVPGCEHIEHVTTASLIGIRESRRIVGEYELNVGDYDARRQFPDQIGVFNNFVDIHPYDPSEAEWLRVCKDYSNRKNLGPGECFGISYGILVPKGWSNLWVAGRCASSDVQVHGAIRVQPAAAIMGQAAGTAAVQAIRSHQPAAAIDTADLVTTLRAAGAYLPQEELAETLTVAESAQLVN